ncbi:MAG TPA: choice-of-anchor tandem repeat GloVer-containing protein [Candidatus Cybelea sp.]|jgi:uncharacterized repeat protein (TIGR03803 family)
MRSSSLGYALSIIAAALLAACSGSQLPIGTARAAPQNHALAARGDSANYEVLYSFHKRPGCEQPHASLIDVDGTLYGTTGYGGAHDAGCVFSVTTAGREQKLYSFRGHQDGAAPFASLVDDGGTLYGTTLGGGGEERGTVFSVTTNGTEQVLHRFLEKGSHGGHPQAALIDVGGTFYGTTVGGGAHRAGTVFSITTGGTERVLHSFGGANDGAFPIFASLVSVDGTLYGTTGGGGLYSSSCIYGNGCGTVFSITTGGSEKVLYNFRNGGTDGGNPVAGLIDVGGTLYGTTKTGGTYNDGTVFSITTSGTENVLYSFGYGTDGKNPIAALIDVGGTLYGTTQNGGGTDKDGTIFSITTSGTETVLHRFGGATDGIVPDASLVDVGGVLYGTTAGGGTDGEGTVFSLTP